MGMSMNTGGGRRRGGRGKTQLMSEINVTPFVDVMLVLLIIFMVTAPLLTVGVPIDLPETEAAPIESEKEPLTISISKDGKVFLMETEVALNELVPKLTAIAKQGLEERVFVRGDEVVDYGTVMQVMGTLNAAGFRRIGLVTELKTDN